VPDRAGQYVLPCSVASQTISSRGARLSRSRTLKRSRGNGGAREAVFAHLLNEGGSLQGQQAGGIGDDAVGDAERFGDVAMLEIADHLAQVDGLVGETRLLRLAREAGG